MVCAIVAINDDVYLVGLSRPESSVKKYITWLFGEGEYAERAPRGFLLMIFFEKHFLLVRGGDRAVFEQVTAFALDEIQTGR